jgi:Spy/CpxP family protein refolding chaperone
MNRNIGLTIFAMIFASTLGASVLTTTVAASPQTASPDPIRDALIPPEVVMSHQQELGLSDVQRATIESDVLVAQGHFIRWQTQLSAATAKLVDILRESRIDQTKALAQMDAVLDLERQVKHAQLTLMVQIKNELTPQQQATAHELMTGSKP